MKRLLRLLAFCVLCLSLAYGQTVVVKRNVILRSKPSSSSTRIATLKPPQKLELVSLSVRNGYRHVRTEDGDEGWVWSNNVQVQDEGDSNEPAGPDSSLISNLLAAHSDAVGQPLVENGTTVCGATGDATDDKRKGLNQNKNRTDVPGDGAYVPIGWVALRDLPLDRSGDLPGAPVMVEGFLVHRVKVENDGGGESTNCHLLGDNEVDWHIYLSDTADLDDISQAVVVETTPRTRPLHKWKKSDLDTVVNQNTSVRISGWLLYDFEHTNAIGTQRASVWEVHPVTKIEVKRNNKWVDLDQ
jgi:uncharacterized protein YgiM (DUF1202 family)